jgi:hypothetical protein
MILNAGDLLAGLVTAFGAALVVVVFATFWSALIQLLHRLKKHVETDYEKNKDSLFSFK